MENVTHSLTGLFLSHAGFNRVTPHATALMILAANAPDIDILGLAGGRLNYFHFHRHFTHSILFAPILAVVLLGLFQGGLRLAGRSLIPWIPAFFAIMAGIASHLLLDLTNNYGIRLLLPFSIRWLARGHLCAIYDLWILCAFFLPLCLAAPLLSKLVGGEIGAARRQTFPSRAFPYLALAFLVVYDGGRTVLHQRALAVLDAREYDGAPALRTAAFPNPSNPLRWHGLVETSTSYRIYDINLVGSFNPQDAQVAFKAESNPAIDAANKTAPFHVLEDFARFLLWRVIPTEAGSEVILTDMRFAFNAQAEVDHSGNVLTSTFQFSR